MIDRFLVSESVQMCSVGVDNIARTTIYPPFCENGHRMWGLCHGWLWAIATSVTLMHDWLKCCARLEAGAMETVRMPTS